MAEAVSMPVHWYYNVPQIKEDYNGWITKYETPKDIHPGVKALHLPPPGKVILCFEHCGNYSSLVLYLTKLLTSILAVFVNKTSGFSRRVEES